jgi:hypothetical protein
MYFDAELAIKLIQEVQKHPELYGIFPSNYDAKDIYSLFNDVLPFNILSFIKEIGLYNKI